MKTYIVSGKIVVTHEYYFSEEVVFSDKDKIDNEKKEAVEHVRSSLSVYSFDEINDEFSCLSSDIKFKDIECEPIDG